MAKAKQILAGEIPKKRAPNPKALREDLVKRKKALEAKGWLIEDILGRAEKRFDGEPFKTRIENARSVEELLTGCEAAEIRHAPTSKNGNTSPAADAVVQLIPVGKIEASPFEPQARRRARFKPEEIENLGDSIVRHGLRQPILVRPISPLNLNRAFYEIVFGERRYLAAKAKGIETIKCFVENLSDAQVIELQYEENHRRQQSDPLDDAFTFKYLMDKEGYSEEQLADRFATSRRNVKEKLRLNFLIPEAVRELADGALPLKHAYYLAKFPPDVQRVIVEKEYAYRYQDKNDGAAPFDDFKEEVEENIIRALANAPFDPEDERLHIKGLKCSNCTERSGFETLLFPDLAENDSCLNKACFEIKTNTHLKLTRISIAERLPNPQNLPVEEIAKKVPLVTDRAWADETEIPFKKEKILTRQNLISAPECEHSTAALVVEGEQKGKTAFVCNKADCKVHAQSANEERKTGPTDYELQRSEREFQVEVATAVREKVFARAIEYFDGGNSFWQYADLVERLLVEFMGMRPHYLKSLTEIFSDWKNFPKDLHDAEQVKNFARDLDRRRRDQLLFLLTFCAAGYSSWELKPQTEVKRIAESFAKINYDLVDAETRLELALDEFKPLAKEYLERVKAGEKAEIPHFWWKEPDDEDLDENSLGETSQG